MATMIQIRNVPEDVHRKLKVRAARRGMTLSDYLKSELERITELPTLEEMLERLGQRPPAELGEPIEEVIRAARGPI